MSASASSLSAGSGRGRISDSSEGLGRDGMICFWFKYLGQFPVISVNLDVRTNHVCHYVPKLCWTAKTTWTSATLLSSASVSEVGP